VVHSGRARREKLAAGDLFVLNLLQPSHDDDSFVQKLKKVQGEKA